MFDVWKREARISYNTIALIKVQTKHRFYHFTSYISTINTERRISIFEHALPREKKASDNHKPFTKKEIFRRQMARHLQT